MLSTPPPINASLPPLTIWYAASAIACRPEEQNRLTVTPPVEVGSPASMAETLAMLCPCGPWGCPQPRMTSSTSRGSSWGVLRSTSWRSEEHTSELQSRPHLVCRLLLE